MWVARGCQVRGEDGVLAAACCIYPCVPLLRPEYILAARDKMVQTGKSYCFPVLPFEAPIQRALRLGADGVEMFDPRQEKPDERRKQELQRRQGLKKEVGRPDKDQRDDTRASSQEEQSNKKSDKPGPALDVASTPQDRDAKSQEDRGVEPILAVHGGIHRHRARYRRRAKRNVREGDQNSGNPTKHQDGPKSELHRETLA